MPYSRSRFLAYEGPSGVRRAAGAVDAGIPDKMPGVFDNIMASRVSRVNPRDSTADMQSHNLLRVGRGTGRPRFGPMRLAVSGDDVH